MTHAAVTNTAPVNPLPLPLCNLQLQKDDGPSRIIYDGDGPIYDDDGNLISDGEEEITQE